MQNGSFRWLEILICVASFALVTMLSDHFQGRITYQDGQGWDGAYYYKMAEQAANGEAIHAESPYVYRLGLPIVAAMLNKHDLLSGFKEANLAANVLLLALFMIWGRMLVSDWRIRCLLTLLFLTQWLGPFRFISFYPATVDNIQYVFLLLGLIGLHVARRREVLGTIGVSLVVFIGVFFRETVALMGLAMLFVGNPLRFTGLTRNVAEGRLASIWRMPKALHFVPLIAAVCALVCTHLVVQRIDDGYSFVRTVVHWVYDKPLLTYVYAVFIVFGPAIVLVLFNWRRSWAFLETNQAFLAFIAAACALAYVGGHDTERYLYMTLPVIYVMIGQAIADNRAVLRSRPLIVLLCATQLISQRIFWTIPDYPNDYRTPLPVLTVLSSKFQYLDLFSVHSARGIGAVAVAEYVLLTAVLLLWLNHRARRVPGLAGSPGSPAAS
jgi:hypothetical protein